MSIQTVFPFTLPRGYIDPAGRLHREGDMRLATAQDEILPMRDKRVIQNPEYAVILTLSRVLTRLGTMQEITPEILENLFTADMNFLQNMYQTINEVEEPVIQVTCPHCGRTFCETIHFTDLSGCGTR